MVLIQQHTELWLLFDTIYVLYGFLTITVKGTVFAGMVTVMEVSTPMPCCNLDSLHALL